MNAIQVYDGDGIEVPHWLTLDEARQLVKGDYLYHVITGQRVMVCDVKDEYDKRGRVKRSVLLIGSEEHQDVQPYPLKAYHVPGDTHMTRARP